MTMSKAKTIGLQTAFKRAHNLGHDFSVTDEEVSCVRCGAYVKRAAGEGIPVTAALVSVPCSPTFHGWR